MNPGFFFFADISPGPELQAGPADVRKEVNESGKAKEAAKRDKSL
jgi:hypothetical protein